MTATRWSAVAWLFVILVVGTASRASPRPPTESPGADPFLAHPVHIRLFSPLRHVTPGRRVTLLWETTNTSTSRVALSPTVDVPPGWVLVLPPDSFVSAPGAVDVHAMVLLPARDAVPGPYEIAVRYESTDGRRIPPASFTLQLKTTRQVGIRFVEGPAPEGDGRYRFIVRVQNEGNTTERFYFEATDDAGGAAEITPTDASLDPGEVVMVVGVGHVDKAGRLRPVHRVRFRAQAANTSAFEQEASASFIVPQGRVDEKRPSMLPLLLRIEGRKDTGGAPRLSPSLYGRGALGDGPYPVLDVDAGGGRQRASVDAGRYSLSFGDRLPRPPGLSGSERAGPGWLASVEGEHWDGQLFAHPSGQTGSWAVGGGATFRPTRRIRLTANYWSGSATGTSVWSVQPAISLDSGVVAELEYAQQARPKGYAFPSAHRVHVGWQRGTRFSRFEWESRDAGYLGAIGEATRWHVVQSLPVSEAVRLTLSSAYRRESSFGIRSDASRWAAHLAGRHDGVGWSFRYAESRVDAGDVTRRRDDVRLHVRQTYPDGNELTVFMARTRGWDGPGPTEWVNGEYVMNYRIAVPRGAWEPFLSVRTRLVRPGATRHERLGFGLRAQLRLGPWRLDARGELSGGPEKSVRLRGDARYDFPNGVTFQIHGGLKAPSTTTPAPSAYDLGFSVTVPVNIPLPRTVEKGDVTGRVIDGDGQPVSGLRVTLGGQTVVTDEDGVYRFPSVTPGVLPVSVSVVPSSKGLVVLPTSTVMVDVQPGETVVQQFQIVRGASVRGKVTAVPATSRGLVWPWDVVSTVPPASRPDFTDLVVVLQQEDTVIRRRISDTDGDFSLDGLPPGRWRITVDGLTSGTLYDVEVTPSALDLSPGGQVDVIVELRPVERVVNVMDGGVVEVLLPPPRTDAR